VPIHPLKNLDPAPDRLRGLGQRFSIGVADSLLCEPARAIVRAMAMNW
jgi:hypothetical protein